jgi:hypothetical protein
LLHVPACGRSQEHPRRFTAAPPLQHFTRAFREWNFASLVYGFPMRDIDRVAAEVLPSKPLALFGAQATIKQDSHSSWQLYPRAFAAFRNIALALARRLSSSG